LVRERSRVQSSLAAPAITAVSKKSGMVLINPSFTRPTLGIGEPAPAKGRQQG
jgi:hypothetical protein